jgi:hypothetical protein
VSAITTVSVKLPDLPVRVTLDGPVAAELVTASVRIQLTGVVPTLNDPTTPLGRLEMLNVTMFENPFSGVKVRVLLPVAPCAILRVAGEADKENVGGRTIVSVTVVLLTREPAVPVMVTVAVEGGALMVAANVTEPW